MRLQSTRSQIANSAWRWRRRPLCCALLGLVFTILPLPLIHAEDSIQTVDTQDFVAEYNSLKLDSSGFPVISYYDRTNSDLKLAHCNDANCAGNNESIVTIDSVGTVGQHTSLVLDSSGFPVISYYDFTNGNLKLVHCNDANCAGNNESIQAIDTTGNVGLYTSLVLDSNGFPVISYRDLTNSDLKLAHCNDANCAGNNESIVTVDSVGIVGLYTSLVLDSNGFPVVSYYDSTNGNLKLVHCNDANCAGNNESIQAIDTTGDVGQYTSLALDSNGFPVVSYLDVTNFDLKLAHCNDANCAGNNESLQTVHAPGLVGEHTSLALDSNGFPVISYYERENNSLKLAHCNDANCAGNNESIAGLDPSGVGLFTSLELDSNGFPVISYYEGFDTALKLAHCDDENCAPPPPQVCGNGVIEGGEQCDLGSALNGQPSVCCTAQCAFVAVNTTCRSASGLCDVAEVCSGTSATCPANGFASAGTSCGGSDAACDALDTCNGSGSCVDNVDSVGTVCASANGVCDPADTCDGVNKTCPATVASAGTSCGGSDVACDALDTCNGSGSCVDNVDSVGTVCASANGVCDPADTCDGASKSCAVVVASAGTSCGGSDAECDAFDTCNGGGGCVDNVDPAGTVCRSGNGVCDAAEACTGTSKSCPVDVGAVVTSGCTVNGVPNQPCQGGVSDDLILGTPGNDVIRGGAGGDTLKGNAGDDLLCGEDGDDLLLGATGTDTLLGGPGEDVLKGEAGNDTLDGGNEDDTLIGGIGIDSLDGGAGNDKLLGNEDTDVLLGDAGNDILNGGDGNDIVDGEADTDDLTGGPGLDTCLNGETLTTCE